MTDGQLLETLRRIGSLNLENAVLISSIAESRRPDAEEISDAIDRCVSTLEAERLGGRFLPERFDGLERVDGCYRYCPL